MSHSPALDSESRSVASFFVLAFGITWLLQVPGVLAQRGLMPGDPEHYVPFAVLGIFGPLVAATVVSARNGGWTTVRALYAPLLKWRVEPHYYLIALVVPGALLTGFLLLLQWAGREGPVSYVPNASRIALAVVIAVAEEVGWRGYALPRLTKSIGPFAASGVIGVLWTFWHVPMFMGLGVPLSFLLVMVLFFTGGSLVYTWLWLRTGGSLLVVVVAHFGAHLNNSHASLPSDTAPLVAATIIHAALGLALMRPALMASASRTFRRVILTRTTMPCV